jgi:hypothetical protein
VSCEGHDEVWVSTGASLCRYNSIVKYKTAFYSFYLPVALAMYMVSEMGSNGEGMW